MTRAYQTSRARRITQPIVPIVIARPRDPSIRSLGFHCFRLFETGGMLLPIAFVHPRNTMTAFMRTV